ncbi:MAG: SH3 domain-containing protein [Leptospiraceae bacterium]|nr:SH3 domain-containing protein [Leptospiraceae bacterium]
MKYLLLLFFTFVSLTAKESGICLTWTEGDGQTLSDCKPSTKAECGKGKKSISSKDTSFQNYKGVLFKDDTNLYEFRKGENSCDKLLIASARDYEGTMSSNWDFTVYSDKLNKGDSAFIYGKSVIVREKADIKSKKLFNADDRQKVKILDKTKERVKVGDHFPSYWFQVEINSKKGWVFGKFIHPDPESKKSFVSE